MVGSVKGLFEVGFRRAWLSSWSFGGSSKYKGFLVCEWAVTVREGQVLTTEELGQKI